MEEANQDIRAQTAREKQEWFAQLSGTEEISWDHLSSDQGESLKDKLKQLIPDPPLITSDNPIELQKQNDIRDKQIGANRIFRDTLYTAVWNQRKYTNRQSLSSIIYVLVARGITDTNLAERATSENLSCHPVFRTRRCVTGNSGTSGNSFNCCMIFVDEGGRVYQNWESYVSDNDLPAGVMVAPHRGIYKWVEGRPIELDKYLTPAASPGRTVLNILDTSSAIGGMAAACVPVAALLTLPVSAPLMAIAGVVGLTSAGYATFRSGSQLVDRSQHEQSINVTDRTARGHWLGVTAGTVGLGAAGATSALAAATNAGKEVGAIAQLTINGMNITSIVVSGGGLANGVLDLILKYNDGDDVTTIDVLQLSASLVLFTHSVYNFRLASTIINDTANSKITGYRETLSNRQRRSFDKVSRETVRIRGTRGKLDVIRNVNEGSKQQFNDLFKINKQLNKQGVRPSFASDGTSILLNDQVQTNAADLRANVQHNVGPDILGQVNQPIPRSHEASTGSGVRSAIASHRLLTPNPIAHDPSLEPRNYAVGVYTLQLSTILVNGVTFLLSNYGIKLFENIINAESFEEIITRMATELPPEVFNYILNLTSIFVENILDEVTSVLKFFISSESVLYRILREVMCHYNNNLTFEEIQIHTGNILNAVREYFVSLNPNLYTDMLTQCKLCNGYYSVCNL